ncbi:RbsD/FucU domain-containing protein [Oleiharenicola sp. Vm1]|uniref:RbsD/FucU domain-containing protein n=1 Tax=Oleiharenicola sp. Vm1 TaxID=3398393 RepID=UPI0039F4F70E
MQTLRHAAFVFLCLAAVASARAGEAPAADTWTDKLRAELPLLGHRNWIVVVDSAYPLQTAPGIETVFVAADQLEVVKTLLAELARTTHVQPTIYTDLELGYVAEKNAPGINTYRAALAKLLAGQPVQSLPHEEIIGKLDEAGKKFRVLIFKTPLTKPYTSVFFELQCGYWNAESEQQLRDAIKAAKR